MIKPVFIVTLGDMFGIAMFCVLALACGGVMGYIKFSEWRARKRRP
jgi:hypothetical protein